MKKILAIMLLSMILTGCGAADMLATQCGGELEAACTFLFGEEHYDDSELSNRVDSNEDRLDVIEAEVNNLINQVTFLYEQDQITTEELNIQQAIINGILAELVLINDNIGLSIKEYIDPCGNGPGYDEILLKLNDGKYIAYFESGNKRFLTILDKNVVYQTTDIQACQFYIDNSNSIVELED